MLNNRCLSRNKSDDLRIQTSVFMIPEQILLHYEALQLIVYALLCGLL